MGSVTAPQFRIEHMKAAFVAIALVALHALAEETTIEVPQGSSQFPILGQVACLEESGGGLCAATYECADGATGELWGDMETHDGRADIGASSPIATGRNCVVAVDGKASVKWFTGHSPDGELVGIAPNHAALRPIQRIQRTGGRGGNLLDYILSAVDTTVPEIVDEQCGHIREGHPEHVRCVESILEEALTTAQIESNAATRCLFDVEWNTWAGSCPTCDHDYPLDPTWQRDLYDAGSQGPLTGERDEEDDIYDTRQCFDHVQAVTREHGFEWFDDGEGSWKLRLLE